MLTQKQFDMLVYLTRQTQKKSQREIAEAAGLSVGTANRVLKELSAEHWIEDGRITGAGREALAPYRVQRAVFLAAGFGSRLVPITLNTPKPLVRVKGKRIIETLLDAVVAAEIPEIYIVRGYLGEQFDQLLTKYPTIKFIENPWYNEANTIASALCAGERICNAYILESDLLLKNPELIQKYQYRSNYLAIPMERTEDWCCHMKNGNVDKVSIGGIDCQRMVGISYWTEQDGKKLAADIRDVWQSPGGKERYLEHVPFEYHAGEYEVTVRECSMADVIEIDTFNELKAIDRAYDV